MHVTGEFNGWGPQLEEEKNDDDGEKWLREYDKKGGKDKTQIRTWNKEKEGIKAQKRQNEGKGKRKKKGMGWKLMKDSSMDTKW